MDDLAPKPLLVDFDWKHPDYTGVFIQRVEALKRLRENPDSLPGLRAYYKENPWQFITDWGCTFDPRNVDKNLPALVPFILFPRQIEWCQWVVESWKERRPGVTPKSRESGVSWLAIALACTLCEFYDGFVAGFGSRKAEYVDKIGAPKSLFWKARKFREMLPPEFRGGYKPDVDSPEMRIAYRQTGSYLTGEGGMSIGRGDRTSIYFVDEAAHLEHPEAIDAALSQTTNCRIDVSTAYGTSGPFFEKVVKWPPERVFRFHWRDDPRKDEEWYQKQLTELDPVVVAQEIDIDFAASVEGVLVPSAWIQAAIDADRVLGFAASGLKAGALDVADEGSDKNAFCGAKGIRIEVLEEWSGKGSDIFATTAYAFNLCDEYGYSLLRFDGDGLGAGVRGDARVLNEKRPNNQIQVDMFRGSGEVIDPKKQDVKGRNNEDYFANAKAQSWWALRMRFQAVYRAVTRFRANGMKDFNIDDLIVIPSDLPNLAKLTQELTQPTYSLNGAGKILIDKLGEGEKSPNLADSLMIRLGKIKRHLVISDQALQSSKVISINRLRRA